MIDKKLTLKKLPYDYSTLEPVISKKIVELHHDKHQAAYVNGTNTALEKIEKARKEKTEINMREVLRDLSFNYNGAVLHQIFWENMRKPKDTNEPNQYVKEMLEENFGTVENFKKEFSSAAVSVEGSGWAVLWKNKYNVLMITQIEKHNLLGLNDFEPVLVLDVWEHAYYLDYLNNRAEFVEKWWKLVNWEDVEKRL